MSEKGTVYLIPCYLHETNMECLPGYILSAIQKCQVFYVENDRTARRYLKRWWKEMVIDDYEWQMIGKAEENVLNTFQKDVLAGKTIGIISEAGCPGIADPGQFLIARAQKLNINVSPLVGPNSILLALMASGMNGQHFTFHGYLPIDNVARDKKIRQMEQQSQQDSSTHIFIETPYRNQQLVQSVLKNCKHTTRFCIAVDITAPTESIITKTVSEWKQNTPDDLHKRPAIFCLQA